MNVHSPEESAPSTARVRRFADNTKEWWRTARPWRSATFIAIVGVNLVLIALYFWSRGGATTHVRIVTQDDELTAYVDGKEIAKTPLSSSGQGGVAIALPGDQVPSLPGPSGIESVTITDSDTGEVLLDDDFSGGASDTWNATSGNWHIDSGVYATTTDGFLTSSGYAWENNVVDMEFKNPTIVTVRIWRQEGDSAVFKIWPFRRYDSRLTVVRDGETTDQFAGARLDLDRGETIHSIIAMVVRPYPIALAVILGTTAIALGLRSRRFDARLSDVGSDIVSSSTGLTLIVAGAAFALLVYIIYFVSDAMPHVPDEVAYVFQAKIFASFHATADPPPIEESFAFFKPPFLHVVDGDWFSQYPFGHPLFLAIGERLGAFWLIPPLLGAASIFLIYRLGHHVYGTATGLLAALLLFFSPFFQMTASNLMSHNTAVFVLLMCLFLMVRPTSRKLLCMFGAGMFLGLFFNMRPLPAMAFIAVLASFMAYELWRAGAHRVQVLKDDLVFAWGGALMLLAYFAYNQITTGNFTDSPQTLTFGETGDWVGFAGSHTVTIGLQNQQALLALMLLVAEGWPAAIGFVFALLPFVLGTRNRWDYFLGAAFLALASVNIFYRNAAVMHGPRFWYETMPFLVLLSARGAMMLIDRASGASDRLASLAAWRPEASGRAIAGLAVFGLLTGLIASSAHGWMLEQRNLWSGIDFMPQRISMLDGFNFTDRRLLDEADEMELENALVFVVPCRQWWCYGSVFWTNEPDLDSSVVWAQQTESEADIELLEHYPGRELYLADYGERLIRPTTVEELQELAGVSENTRRFE